MTSSHRMNKRQLYKTCSTIRVNHFSQNLNTMFTKNSLILILFVFLINACQNDREIFLSQDYQYAFKHAQKNNKYIFIDFYTTWCGSCKGYDNIIFPDSIFQAYLKTDFYSLKLNAELPENKKIVDEYKIAAYPTLIIANPEGVEINRIVGYKSDEPQYYIDLITSILNGKENLKSFKEEFLKNTENAEYANEIILKLFQKEEYQSVNSFIQLIKSKSKNDSLLYEADLFLAFAKSRDRKSPNPSLLKNRLTNDPNLSDYWRENILTELIGYYKNTDIDSFEYYSFELENKYPMSFYWNRNFALYLYENNRDLETAYRITYNYAEHNSNDHWTPYLQGFQLASKGKKKEAFDNFDKWLIDYKHSEDSKTRYYKYIDLAVFCNYNLEKAVDYAIQFEKDVPTITNRKLLAKLYYLTNQKEKSIRILKETIPLIETTKGKNDMDVLIEEYSR